MMFVDLFNSYAINEIKFYVRSPSAILGLEIHWSWMSYKDAI